jgi:DNA polymerase I-like protein with 3'-5' exonuclease and polymerase domains
VHKLDFTKDYFLITDAEDIKSVLKEIEANTFIAYDVESTGVNVRQDKIIGFSITATVNTGYYFPILEWDDTLQSLRTPDFCYAPYNEPHLIILNALKNKKLIMHNASFDTRITYHNFNVDLLASLHADTMLMRHTLMEEGPFALKELAIIEAKAINLDNQDAANQEQLELETNVKMKGGKWLKSNKEMYKADLNILAKYAAADTDITLRLFNKYDKELKDENLYEFFYNIEVMPLYVYCTIPMEFEGIHLDMDKLKILLNEIENDIKIAENNVVIALLATEEGQQFVKQRLNEEFAPSNKGAFAQEVCKLFDLPLPKLSSGKFQITKKNIDLALSNITEPSKERACLFLNDVVNFLMEYEIEEIQKRLLIAKEGTEHPINISSKQQMGKIVFDFMGIKPLSTTDKGSPQFNEDMIEHLASQGFDWARELRVYNKLIKIHGSSYKRFLDEQEDGVFYPYFKQHGTTSGRYSSNIQQLPRPLEEGSDDERVVKYTNQIRALFIPKKGYVFIDDDYSSLEPCVFAHDAGDQALLDIFIKSEDFYSKIAMMALGLTDCSADKKASNFLKNLYPQHRQDAKAYSLGIRYGAEAGKVAQLLNVPMEQAQELIDKYFDAFPGLKKKMDQYRLQAKKTGKVISEFGRVRHLPKAKELYTKFGDDILDYSKFNNLSRKHYISFNSLKDIRREYKNILNNALNFPIQSAATSIINQAGIAIMKEFIDKGIDGWISAFIHDQLIVSVKEEQKEIAAKIVQQCMENTNTIQVPLVAVPQFAYNFKDGH